MIDISNHSLFSFVHIQSTTVLKPESKHKHQSTLRNSTPPRVVVMNYLHCCPLLYHLDSDSVSEIDYLPH